MPIWGGSISPDADTTVNSGGSTGTTRSPRANNSSYKITLTGPNNQEVVFEASIQLAEERAANYDNYPITHLPADIFAYRNTSGRAWSLSGKLISRNVAEANLNASYLSTIRSWILPGFGANGSTPPILKLSAYYNKNINKVPCILRSYSWTFPAEVDFIFAADEMMPVVGDFTINLIETYSAAELAAGEWKITPGGVQTQTVFGGSSIDPTADVSGLGPTSALRNLTGNTLVAIRTPNLAFATGAFPGLATLSNLPSVGAALGLPSALISTIPQMASLYGVKISPELSQITTQIPQIINNPYITGVGAQTIQQATTALTRLTAPTVNTVADQFGRSTALNVPTFVEGD